MNIKTKPSVWKALFFHTTDVRGGFCGWPSMLRLFSVRASRSSIVLVCRAVVDNLRWSIATESTSDVEFRKLLQAGPKKRRVGWTEDFAAGSDFKDG